MMTDLEKCKRAFKLGATKDQLKVWVVGNKLTTEQYEEITGEAYVASEE
jgi:hypothetical protein